MALPEELHRLTVESLASMRMDPFHRLHPSRRLTIYQWLNNRPENPEYRKLRGWLGLLAARRVLPIWHELRPVWVHTTDRLPEGGQLPDRLLSIARSILRGSIDLKRAWQETNDLWYFMENMNGAVFVRRPEVPNKAYYAADACFKALHETFCVEFLQHAVELEWTSDEYLRDNERDAAACAVLAEAGGADAGTVELSRRLSFWEWWLTEAIPTAWTYATEPGVQRTVVLHKN